MRSATRRGPGGAVAMYAAVFRLNVQLGFAARGWLAIRVPALLAALAVPFYVWRSIFESRASVNGFEWPQIKTFLLIAAIFTTLMNEDGGLGWRISHGDVIADLVRPWRQSLLRLTEAAGRSVLEFTAAIVIFVGLGALVGGLALPSGPLDWLLFLASVLLALLVKCCIIETWTLATFWTLNSYGVDRVRQAVSAVLSGGIVPIAMFPSWLSRGAELLPFQTMVTTPAEIATGRAGHAAALLAIGVQLLWLCVLLLLAEALWALGPRRMAAQGG